MTNLLTHAVGIALGHRAAAKIRQEHDTWARTAQLHTAYYTVQGDARGAHSTMTFVKVARFGPHTGQLITDNGASSWTMWYQSGPFTTLRQTTQQDLNVIDLRAEPKAMRRAEQAVTNAVLAELAELYPASVHALQAA